MTDKEKELIDLAEMRELYIKLLMGSPEVTPEIIIVPSEEGPVMVTEKGSFLLEVDEDEDEDLLED